MDFDFYTDRSAYTDCAISVSKALSVTDNVLLQDINDYCGYKDVLLFAMMSHKLILLLLNVSID